MASIASHLRPFKQNPSTLIDDAVIREACEHANHRWRDRVLGPTATVRLMVLQMLHGNPSCRRLTRIARVAVSVTAYVNARARLPVDVLGMVLWRLGRETPAEAVGSEFRGPGWRGHRVMLIDGSGVSMPDTPALQHAFGQPGRVKPGCGFPVMHTLWLFDAATGLLLDFVAGRWNRHDLADAHRLHPMLNAGDVLVGDRPRKLRSARTPTSPCFCRRICTRWFACINAPSWTLRPEEKAGGSGSKPDARA